MFVHSPHIACGILMIRDSVGIQAILKFAEEMQAADPKRLKLLHVRGCAKDATGIDFEYDMDVSDEKQFRKFVSKMKDRVRKHFGGENLVGCSISNHTYTLQAA